MVFEEHKVELGSRRVIVQGANRSPKQVADIRRRSHVLDHGAEIFRLHGMTKVDTEKVVAEVRAEGDKQVAQIQASQLVEVAKIEKEIADLTASRTRELGRADAKVVQLATEADADR